MDQISAGNKFKKKYHLKSRNNDPRSFTLDIGGNVVDWRNFLKRKVESEYPKLSPMFASEPVDVKVSERLSSIGDVTVKLLPSERIMVLTANGPDQALFLYCKYIIMNIFIFVQ